MFLCCPCGLLCRYAQARLNRVKTFCLVVVTLNYFWTCLLQLIPTVSNLDLSSVSESGPLSPSVSFFHHYYHEAWASRATASVVFDALLLAPNVAVLVYIIFVAQFDTCAKRCSRAAKRREILRKEKRRLKLEKAELALKPWAKPSTASAAKV